MTQDTVFKPIDNCVLLSIDISKLIRDCPFDDRKTVPAVEYDSMGRAYERVVHEIISCMQDAAKSLELDMDLISNSNTRSLSSSRQIYLIVTAPKYPTIDSKMVDLVQSSIVKYMRKLLDERNPDKQQAFNNGQILFISGADSFVAEIIDDFKLSLGIYLENQKLNSNIEQPTNTAIGLDSKLSKI